jgi:hypothetical protein
MKTMNRLQSLAIGLGAIDVNDPTGADAVAALASQIIHAAARADSDVDDLERVLCHLFTADDAEVQVPVFNSETDAEWFDLSWRRAKARLESEFDLAYYPQPKTN